MSTAARYATRASSALSDARSIVALGSPLLVNNLAVSGMALADTLMAGRLGPTPLASVAVGASYYNFFLFTGLGVLMALGPTVAPVYGAGGSEAIGRYLRQGVWLALILAVPLVAGLWLVHPVLVLIGTDPIVIPAASGYVHAMSAGLPALLVFLSLRFVSEGLGRTAPIMTTAVAGLAVNVLGNWVFMYGRLGAPALGAVGTGVASAITMWVMAGVMRWQMSQRFYRTFALFGRFEPPDLARLREILALGLPICGSVLSESALFVAAGLMMSTLGAHASAAHQIAISYASLMFMLPLALHSATTIHVGHALGRGDPRSARRAGFTGIALCGALMLLSALVIALGHRQIASLYTTDAQVRVLASQLLLMAGLFQVSDGLQVGGHGALRGFRDARVPMLLSFACYWLIGFPLSVGLGLWRGGGPAYIWFGLIVGLTASAIAVNWRFALVARRRLSEAGL
jgi:MATE family, multidrug efflux pump